MEYIALLSIVVFLLPGTMLLFNPIQHFFSEPINNFASLNSCNLLLVSSVIISSYLWLSSFSLAFDFFSNIRAFSNFCWLCIICAKYLSFGLNILCYSEQSILPHIILNYLFFLWPKVFSTILSIRIQKALILNGVYYTLNHMHEVNVLLKNICLVEVKN